ncbi:MAG: hypothetical protein ACLFVY_13700 [Phycisphaerae bacterium]
MADERKKSSRRWVWIVAGLIVLLAGLTLLTPAIASSGWGESMIASIVADSLNGEVSLEDLSISWGGPTEIRGFLLRDLDGRERIELRQAALSRGLWGLAWNAEDFGELTLTGVRLTVWADRPSPLLPPSKEPEAPSERDQPSELPAPIGRITVRDALVTIVRADGSRRTIGPIEGRVSLQTLSNIVAEISVATPEGSSLRLRGDVKDLVRAGRLDPAGASGSASIRTLDGPLAAGPFAALAGGSPGLTGFLTIDANATFTGRRAEMSSLVDFDINPGAGRPPFAGAARGSATLSRDANGGPMVSSAQLRLTDLSADGKRLGDRPITLQLRRLSRDTDGGVRVAKLGLAGPAGTLTLTDGHWPGRDVQTASGTFDANADLQEAMAMIAPLLGRPQPPAVWGRLRWSASVRSGADGVRLAGGGSVSDLRVGRGDNVVRRKTVRVDHEALLATDGSRVSLETFELAAPQLLRVTLSGDVTELRTRRLTDLSGEYEAWWEAVNVVLAELAPGATENVTLKGRSSGPLAIRGPLHQPKLSPSFRKATGTARLGWASGRVYGIPLEKADIEAKLVDGTVQLPVREIASGEGRFRVGGVVDLTGKVPVYRLDGTVQPLENIALTQPLLTELLGRLNPVFMQTAGVSGTVSLKTKDLVIPLDANALSTGGGSGQLDLSKTQLIPRGLLGRLIPDRYIRPGESLPVSMNTMKFALRDGRIHYRDFRMTLPRKYALEFSGSVGLDGTLDLAVGVPIHAGLLEQLGVKGKAATYARLLEGTVVQIPLRGTRTRPRLDLSAVDKRGLLKQIAEDVLRREAARALENLLNGKRQSDDGDAPQAGDPNAPTTQPARKKPDPVESIFDLIDTLGGSRRKDAEQK